MTGQNGKATIKYSTTTLSLQHISELVPHKAASARPPGSVVRLWGLAPAWWGLAPAWWGLAPGWWESDDKDDRLTIIKGNQ